jgi:hypothetical protein
MELLNKIANDSIKPSRQQLGDWFYDVKNSLNIDPWFTTLSAGQIMQVMKAYNKVYFDNALILNNLDIIFGAGNMLSTLVRTRDGVKLRFNLDALYKMTRKSVNMYFIYDTEIGDRLEGLMLIVERMLAEYLAYLIVQNRLKMTNAKSLTEQIQRVVFDHTNLYQVVRFLKETPFTRDELMQANIVLYEDGNEIDPRFTKTVSMQGIDRLEYLF